MCLVNAFQRILEEILDYSLYLCADSTYRPIFASTALRDQAIKAAQHISSRENGRRGHRLPARGCQ